MTATITALYRYPVKGLSPDPLDSAEVEAGRCIAFDRAFAIENGPSSFDPENPAFLPKSRFLMLMLQERLAALETSFDDRESRLTIARDGKQVTSGRLDERIGRQLVEQFFAAYMSQELRGAPRVLQAEGHSFSDVAEQVWSLINLASVRELERVVGRTVDPLRFRANIYVDGLDPWREFDWVGSKVAVDGKRLFDCVEPTERCAATNVDPATGARDMSLPHTLMQAFGHMKMGVYLRACADGTVTPGMTIEQV